jgi:hypothetical protein
VCSKPARSRADDGRFTKASSNSRIAVGFRCQEGGEREYESQELFMDGHQPAYFDLKTVALLRETVEDAWISIRPEQRASVSRSLLAERILNAAAQGERDRARLLDAALGGFAADS